MARPILVCAQEVTGKLSWYDSKRSDAKLLGQQDLAGANVEFVLQKIAHTNRKGSTLKDVETCCFSVEIHNVEPPYHLKTTLYLAHKSRREARAWMDAIAKVGLIQSEMMLEDEMYGAGAGQEMEFGHISKNSLPRKSSASSTGSMRKNTLSSAGSQKLSC